MATKRFCDICLSDTPLTEADDKPFIRVFEYGGTNNNDSLKAQAHVMVMNEGNHVLTDVCIGCKLKIVNEGKPVLMQTVATLQSTPTTMPATPLPPIRTFEPSIKPESSLPGDRPSPRMG